MNDCPNADVRDQLPDLLHGRLDAMARAAVEAHLEGCADCRAELALLRDIRASLRRTPALDLTAISAAVQPRRAPVRSSWAGWRVAAAITVLVVGGASLVVMRRIVSSRPDTVRVAVAPVSGAPAQPSVPVETTTVVGPAVKQATPAAEIASAPVRGGRELAMAGGSLTDLSDHELASLLKEIETLDAVPSTEVESAGLSPVAPRRSTP